MALKGFRIDIIGISLNFAWSVAISSLNLCIRLSSLNCFFNGLRSSEYASYTQFLHSTGRCGQSQFYEDAHYIPLQRKENQLLQHKLSFVRSRTTSRYRTAVTKSNIKICMAVRYPNPTLGHAMMLPPWILKCSMKFWGLLRMISFLQTFSCFSAIFKINRFSFVNITLLQSGTVELTCCRHHFKCAPLDWTDRRRTQIRVIPAFHS